MSEFSTFARSAPPLTLLCLVGAVYLVGRHRLALRYDDGASSGHADRSGRAIWFFLGLLTLVVALAPPLDNHAERSLSAHMSQHVILMVIAPLFLVLADPWERLVAGLPERVRSFGGAPSAGADRVEGADPHAFVVSVDEADHAPDRSSWIPVAVAATVAQSVIMWVWHVPSLYDIAVRTDAVHAVEHLSFLGAGLWFWWAVGGTGRRRNGFAALIVFVAALPGTALGSALMLAPNPWFPSYGDLQDQQVAGAIMWSVGGAVYLAGAVVLFLSWLSQLDDPGDEPGAVSALTPRRV